MSTRSRIAVELSTGYVSAYHHWDGYPQWLGKTLQEQYNTRPEVIQLIDGGDMSSCWSDRVWTATGGQKTLPEGTFAPEYYSARGEDTPPEYSESTNALFELTQHTDGEYLYIFNKENVWECYDTNQWAEDYDSTKVKRVY